ncbi:MAG: M48 family metallopeptidase [Prosthecobacter sp.]|uniref:M48 family metallopeptidase n=1 Tax=Prosthecobacter sp. TaxID=1965333 RepID=UPI00260CCFF3|nr:M48 family metallopeptidase [Prosthecobacter sp.]MCF7789445.1 M48 family metallopeptidase [Prosthecobacter sp.]
MIPTFRRLLSLNRIYAYGDERRRGCMSMNPRIVIGLLIIAGTLLYHQFATTTYDNKFTGRSQTLAWATPEEEIALGLESAPQMILESGGLSRDAAGREMVGRVGARLIASTAAKETSYQFKFHLLADTQTVNAFALPGGQIFITEALFRRLKSEDQLAGVLGHEMGHVVGRHSNEQMANSQLMSGLAQGVGVMFSDGHNNSGAQIANMVAQWRVMTFSREDESESDALGVRFMMQAGYNPEALIGVMEILEQVSGGSNKSDFMSSHPNPANRMEHIREVIVKERAGR